MTPAEFKVYREYLELSQAGLAPLLGYGHAMRISEIERGVREPSAAALLLLRAYVEGWLPLNWQSRKPRKKRLTPAPK